MEELKESLLINFVIVSFDGFSWGRDLSTSHCIPDLKMPQA